MKILLTACCMLVVSMSTVFAQLDTLWTRAFGGPGSDGFVSVVPTSDDGFTAVGYTYSFGAGDVDVYLVKVDAAGDTLWGCALGGEGRDYGYSVCETGDGGFALTGYTTSFGAGEEDVYVIRVDAAGDTVWTRTYGGTAADEGRGICTTADGCLLVTGQTASYGAGDSDLYLLKLDASGDTVWTRTFGGVEMDLGASVSELADGSYGVCGSSGSNSGNIDIFLLKMDTNGTVAWVDYYGDTGDINPDWGVGMKALPDSGMIVAGYRAIEGSDPGNLCLLKTDSDGSQEWYRQYAGSFYEYGFGVCETHDGGYIVCGAEKDPSNSKNNLFLTKRVPGSGWVWTMSLGDSTESEWGASISEIVPGQYIVSGYTESSGAGKCDGWIVRLSDPESSVETGEVPERGAFLTPPAPNPFNPTTTIRYGIKEPGHLSLSVYDIAGRLVRVLVDESFTAGEYSSIWDGRDNSGNAASSGIYFVRMTSRAFAQNRKIVLLR